MSAALALVAGLLAGAATWRLVRPTLDTSLFARENHRGVAIPTAAGLAVVLAVLVVDGALIVIEAAGVEIDDATGPGRRVVVLGTLALALLGLLDDLAGVGESGGFRAHLRALLHGRLTTGGIKLFGGAAVSVVLVATVEPGSLGRILADAAVVALAANLGNLLDRRPGRVLKVVLVVFALELVLLGTNPALFGVAVAVGAGTALLVPDLRERAMLGDTGANALGGALGLGVVLVATPTARNVVLVVLLGLNLASEAISFSRVIDATPGLRWLDQLGRVPLQTEDGEIS